MSRVVDWVVVGGGLTGAALAWELQRSGAQTLLIDREIVGEGAGAGRRPKVMVGFPIGRRPRRWCKVCLPRRWPTIPVWGKPWRRTSVLRRFHC
ncbi:MAG: FAD-dependent oxidoreductase [Oscillatoriales cyanobacterium SM2_1_8]|nr:FAD-dependent oxidoreductase [Oscillatoriales cyanobacterium SM2_1_8]